jgi:hypothetical protein
MNSLNHVANVSSLHSEPTVNDIVRNLLAERSFRAVIGTLEATAGLAVTGFFTFGVVGMIGIGVIANAWLATTHGSTDPY